MEPPRNLDDHSQCIKIGPDQVLAWCVECNDNQGDWRAVGIVGTALVSVSMSQKSFSCDLCRDSVTFRCLWCYANLSPLFADRRAEVISLMIDRRMPA